jgi:hypothetical protein
MKLVLGVAMAATGVICLFLANHQYWELQSQVNDQLPADQKFEPIFWTLSTRQEFRRIQRRVLPNSSRPKRAWRFAVAGFCFFFSGVALVIAALQ